MIAETSVSGESRRGWRMAFGSITEHWRGISGFGLFIVALPLLVNGLFAALLICELLASAGRLYGPTARLLSNALSALVLRGAVIGLALWLIELRFAVGFSGFSRFPIGVVLWMSAVLILTTRRPHRLASGI
ncbi:MAG TPA: hypothetical protein VHD56_10925 [Tepidisphaeraceae bacterium]|nr:hypothetical protein [Tepidisphaeraceae bacterium]